MNCKKCREIRRCCDECNQLVTACLERDEFFVCQDCDRRMPIDKEVLNRSFNWMFKKADGKKLPEPDKN